MEGRTLGRDYKHVKRTEGRWFSGWTGLFIGLVIGFAAALGLRLQDRDPSSAELPATTVEPSTPTDAAEGFTFPDILEQGEAGSARAEDAAGKAPAIAMGPVALQVGWFRQLEEAEKVHARLAQHGVSARMQRLEVGDESWYRLRIGPIDTAEEIRDIRARLDEVQIQATPVTKGQWEPVR